MAPNVSDQLVDQLHAWGVRRIFGYPGDGINGFFGALGRATDRIEFIQARHEEMAAFMACAHAKYTGEIGVCVSTSGPGAVHMLTGLYDAKLDHVPVLALVGQQARAALGSSYLQEIDLPAVFKDVAHEYVQMATAPEQVRHLLDRAVRTALAERTPTCLILPSDVQELDAVPEPPHEHYMSHSSSGWSRPRVLPEDADLRRAADALNAGERVAILVGQGRWAPETRSRTSPMCWAPGWPRPCSASRCCLTTCRGSPAGSGCSAPSRAGISWPAATRC